MHYIDVKKCKKFLHLRKNDHVYTFVPKRIKLGGAMSVTKHITCVYTLIDYRQFYTLPFVQPAGEKRIDTNITEERYHVRI